VSNGRMIDEGRIGKDLKGSGLVYSRYCPDFFQE
jgi:hypothetical protein